jgi:uncharacterized iron-regulated protein
MRALILALSLLATPLSAAEIAPADLDRLPKAQVVILGEVHDNAIHHQNQARAVAALAPKALVFEMLTPDQAARATPETRATPDALSGALGWEGTGWPDFALYWPIFAAAPEATLYGGGLPRAEVRRAITEGAATVFGPEAARFGLDQPLDPDDQSAREAEQMTAHCDALPRGMLPGMVEAQRLRDAALARAVLKALDDTGGPVALITGNGHAQTQDGVPVMLALAAPETTILTIGQYETEAPDTPPFDLWLVTEAAERGDPCAAFR